LVNLICIIPARCAYDIMESIYLNVGKFVPQAKLFSLQTIVNKCK